MMQMLELAEKDFKTAIINMVKDLANKVVMLNDQMGNLCKEM